MSLGDRQHIVFTAPSSQSSRLPEETPSGPGRLWGAVESEVADGRVGQWERHRGEVEALVLRAARFGVRRGAAGSLLSIAEAAGLEPEIPERPGVLLRSV